MEVLAEQLQPEWIKVLDHSTDWLERIEIASPNTRFLGRLFLTQAEQSAMIMAVNPAAEGRAFARRIAALGKLEYIEYWESLNEVLGQDSHPDLHKRYAAFQLGFLSEAHREGFTPVAMNLANGNGTIELSQGPYVGVMEAYDYIGVHEYGWPIPLYNDPPDGQGGMWLTLRYRRWLQWVFDKWPDKKLLVTEFGATQMASEASGTEDVGWKGPVTGTAHPYSRSGYIQDAAWYVNEVSKDPYVDGVMLFSVGADGNEKQWQSFESVGVMEEIYTKLGLT